jgi:glycosyltransferase involved in cell wall biosynthesis
VTQLKRRTICLITGGYIEKNLRLQPWRYLSEVAQQLSAQGHKVTVVTDGGTQEPANRNGDEVTVQRLPTVNRFRWQQDDLLQRAVRQANPDLILWHLGLPSFAHQQFNGWPQVPVVGIFPGLIYKPQELFRLGLRKIVRGYRLSAIHVAGTLVPKSLIPRALQPGLVSSLVVQTKSTRDRLLETGLLPNQVKVIAPGVDAEWNGSERSEWEEVRAGLGYRACDTVIIYFGSPAPLRGLHTLLEAFSQARVYNPSLKLLILNRRHADELLAEDAELRRLIEDEEIKPHIKIVSGFLSPDVLVKHVAASDIVALPFELVPADAPLSLLEARALGKPVVTTRVASLPELLAPGKGYLAEPGDPESLAQALHDAAQHLHRCKVEGWHTPQQNGHMPARSWKEVGEEWSHFVQSL